MVSTPDKQYKVVGTRPIRPDGLDKVTGRAQYGSDIRLTGMLFGRIKRSPHAHANIKKIDVSKALALPGVKAVITHADLPIVQDGVSQIGEGVATATRFLSENVLANKKALYRGHAIAAVCATDPHIAEDALDLIEVEYEVLTPVTDVREAMADNAPVLHDDLRTRDTAPLAADTSDKATNIAAHLQFKKGDTAAGFAEADVIIEREFETGMFHQGYIETHNGTAFWGRDGQMTIWCSTQGSFMIRQLTSQILKVPVSQINVIPMEIGGGFGGKTTVYMEPLAALLSKKTNKPVKMLMNRTEVFEATGPTSGSYSRVKIGAKRDGSITAAEVYLAFDAGAFPGSPVGAGAMCALGPYDIPNLQVDGYDVVVNKPKVAAYRAPGAPAGEFGVEAVVNEMAQRLQMDPMDLRLKNSAHEGTVQTSGAVFPRIGATEVMEAVKNSPHYKSELQGENRGRGVALGFWFNGSGERSGNVSINSDGTLSLVTGNVDIGGLRAAIAMMLAETLGIDYDSVKPHIVATDDVGPTGVTGGSSSAFASGWAMYEIGQELRKKLAERAARIWEVPADEVVYGDDAVLRGPKDADGKVREISFTDLASRLATTGGGISVGLTSQKTSVGAAFAGHIVDLEVDRDTGKVTVLRYTAVQDVGTAIHPSYVEGQIQGGAAQGLGMALSEEYWFGKDGGMQNASFLDYRMPTALDLPMIETVLVEVPNPGHPYGVRGVGEVCIVPPMAAVQAAIEDAVGLRLNVAPMSPRVLLDAWLENDQA